MEKQFICSTCKNRKHDLKRGICCRLTDEKAKFMETCESYCADEEAISKKKENKRYLKDDILPGAAWFRVFAMAWGVTFIYKLFFGGMLALADTSNLGLMIFPLAAALIFAAFYYYTWWLTARKGYRFCYNIGALVIFLFAVVHCIYLFVAPFFLAFSSMQLAWLGAECFALLFGLKLRKVNSVEKDHVPFDNKSHKYSYIAVSVLAVVTLITTIFYDL